MRRDAVIAAGVISFCILNYFWLIPTQVTKEGSSPIYPYLIITFLLVVAAAYFMVSIHIASEDITSQKSKHPREKRSLMEVILTVSFITIYASVIEYVGFLLSTIPLLIGCMILYGSKNYIKISTVSILFSLIISYIFKIALHSTLPTGFLEQIIFGW